MGVWEWEWVGGVAGKEGGGRRRRKESQAGGKWGHGGPGWTIWDLQSGDEWDGNQWRCWDREWHADWPVMSGEKGLHIPNSLGCEAPMGSRWQQWWSMGVHSGHLTACPQSQHVDPRWGLTSWSAWDSPADKNTNFPSHCCNPCMTNQPQVGELEATDVYYCTASWNSYMVLAEVSHKLESVYPLGLPRLKSWPRLGDLLPRWLLTRPWGGEAFLQGCLGVL